MEEEKDQRLLERILDGVDDPRDLPFTLLKKITNDFSEERKIGQGGFGVVYKGVLLERIVAVKRIRINAHTFDDELFHSEVNNLMNINHRNVVRFLGLCSQGYQKPIEDDVSGKYNWSNVLERLLCFEYISNGSLDNHIKDELRGLEWETRYEIITGICKGLRYLHKEKNIIHMDLKPANILLDHQDGKYMVPKITDFGLSRSKINSHPVGQLYGTLEYMAPEYRDEKKTTQSCDIYSLGLIIIELVTGCKGVPNKNNVLRRWRHRWKKPPTQLQYQQITRCIDIAGRCREKDPIFRPSILEIIKFLSESESTYWKISSSLDEDDMLRINPLELRLPSELKNEISCLVELTNDTCNFIFAFNIQLPSSRYNAQPDKGIVRPKSKYSVKITVQTRDVGERDHADKFIVQSMQVKASEGLRDRDIQKCMFEKKRGFVDEVDLMVVYESMNPQEIVDEYIKTGVTTSQQEEHAPNELPQGILNSPGETSSKENTGAVTVTGTNPCKIICENTANLDKFNETMRSLNPDIVQCFKFCSIFPRGSKLRRDDLVRLWVAQGFVKTSRATEDMEDIAEGYIQELVSCSFLQPISDTDCFTIHDVLHDTLDMVAEKCFRIENVSSHRGEGWEGDVPRDIHHLLIQYYDGELITETIIGLEYLRTLIVYVVEKGTPVEERVIESICKRLPKLRVLAVAFSREHDPIKQPNKFSFPESVGQLKYLRYLTFRTQLFCNITLPSTLNKLQHIQVLDFGDSDILEFTFPELVNLRHILCWAYLKFPNVGRLSSLQTLPGFKVSNVQGCELKQLRGLNKLRGKLRISGLENVKSKEEALEANLAAKKRLTELTPKWGYGDDTRCSPEVEADVLEGLCPPVGLQKLDLSYFAGWRYPDWMVGKHSGGPKYLQELHLCSCSQPVPASGLAEAFPHLRALKLGWCRWVTLPGDMEHLTSLKELEINSCSNIRSLPTLPKSLEKFTLKFCNAELKSRVKQWESQTGKRLSTSVKRYSDDP